MEGESIGTEALLRVLNAEQLRNWRKQRERLRSNYRQLWSVSSDEFQRRWNNEQSPEVLLAMVLAAREDVENENEHLSVLLDALLPELAVLVGTLALKIDKKGTTTSTEDDELTYSSTSDAAAAAAAALPADDCKAEKQKEDAEGSDEEVDVCELMRIVAEKRDVETAHFSVASVDAYSETLSTDVSARNTAREALLVGRSCVLLQFCTCMLLLVMSDYQQQQQQQDDPILPTTK